MLFLRWHSMQTKLAYSSGTALWSDRLSKVIVCQYSNKAYGRAPSSFHTIIVDVGRRSCARGEGDLEISELFNHVQDGVIDKQG